MSNDVTLRHKKTNKSLVKLRPEFKVGISTHSNSTWLALKLGSFLGGPNVVR